MIMIMNGLKENAFLRQLLTGVVMNPSTTNWSSKRELVPSDGSYLSVGSGMYSAAMDDIVCNNDTTLGNLPL